MTPAKKPAKRAEETLIRPGSGDNITFLWRPGAVVCEMIYRPNEGLRLAVKHKNKAVQYADAFDKYRPLPSAAEAARRGVVPSASTSYSSLGRIAEEMREFIRRYFDCDERFESVAVLYALHTWVYELFHAVPYLRFQGLWANGKSRGTDTIGALCYRPLSISGSATPAVMFRQIETYGGTLLFDEADMDNSQVGADIIKVLNCGYEKGKPITR